MEYMYIVVHIVIVKTGTKVYIQNKKNLYQRFQTRWSRTWSWIRMTIVLQNLQKSQSASD